MRCVRIGTALRIVPPLSRSHTVFHLLLGRPSLAPSVLSHQELRLKTACCCFSQSFYTGESWVGCSHKGGALCCATGQQYTLSCCGKDACWKHGGNYNSSCCEKTATAPCLCDCANEMICCFCCDGVCTKNCSPYSQCTLCKNVMQCLCLDCRCGVPCDADVPMELSLCGLFCLRSKRGPNPDLSSSEGDSRSGYASAESSPVKTSSEAPGLQSYNIQAIPVAGPARGARTPPRQQV